MVGWWGAAAGAASSSSVRVTDASGCIAAMVRSVKAEPAIMRPAKKAPISSDSPRNSVKSAMPARGARARATRGTLLRALAAHRTR